MIPLFSTQQVRDTDEFAIKNIGLPGIVLMENAAFRVFNIINSICEGSSSAGFLCGKGNNGGDGFAVARNFSNAGFQVVVIYLGNEDEMSGDCKTNYSILKKMSGNNDKITLKNFSSLKDINLLANSEIVFDALLGSGAKGKLRSPYNDIVTALNKLKAKKAAIDIPTGLDADTGFGETIFKADYTVTLGEFKKGLFINDGYANCGEIIKGEIGIDHYYYEKHDVSDYLIEPEDVYDFLPGKKKQSHKYSAGKVLTIAGSGSLPGAAVLASKSALKAGAGSSILAFPKSVRKFAYKKLNEVVVKSYEDNGKEYITPENIEELENKIKWADVVAIGPGLGRSEETREAVLRILSERKCNKFIIDADAIFALGQNKYYEINLKDFVITPHHGEFADLIGISIDELKRDIFLYGKNFAADTGAFLVLKGAPTIIFTPTGDNLINTTGNPGMAKFGTGDVLTGVLAAISAQQKDIEKAVICGVYLHSLAADLLLKDFTEYTFTAEDIIKNLPKAFKFLRDSFA